jgi:VWFA-related protein
LNATRILLSLAVSTLILPALAASGQTTSSAPDQASDKPVLTLKVQAREVILPVTVRDKKGALVTSLRQSDFTLTEDGRAQTIKSFTRETNLPFRLGLLVDTSRSLSSALDAERKAAGKFVDQMLPTPNETAPKAGPASKSDQAFLIHFDREVELLRDFTDSREKLHHELDEMGPSRPAQSDNQSPDNSGGTSGNGNPGSDRGGWGGGRGGDSSGGQSHSRGGGTQLYDAIFLASDELMKTVEGRKALIVFSDGVDRNSKENLNDAIDAADRAGLAVYTIYFKGEQERTGGSGFPGSGGRRGGMGGGGYPGGGYPGGGGQRRGSEEPQVDGKKIMEKIATRTGGRFFEAKKKDSLDEIYGQIAEELRGQYLLTYTPDLVDKEGGFHKIALKASKDDLTVVTREGYYAPEETK